MGLTCTFTGTIVGANGTVLAGVPVELLLCGPGGTYYTSSHNLVERGLITAVSNGSGVISQVVARNDELTPALTFWRVECKAAGLKKFIYSNGDTIDIIAATDLGASSQIFAGLGDTPDAIWLSHDHAQTLTETQKLQGITNLGITSSTTLALGVGSINLGHATANTLTASSGVLSIENKAVLDQTNTLAGITNKTFVAPELGAATATSINGITIAPYGNSGTLTMEGNISTGGPYGGSINTSNNGGEIDLSGDGSGGSGGDIYTYAQSGNNGGNIDTHADQGAGGSIDTSGRYGQGGIINTSSLGGDINTSGSGANAGGSIYTGGGATGAGGSINTSNGGGGIDTTGTGVIGLGSLGSRTSFGGGATIDRNINFPDASGTLLLDTNTATITNKSIVATQLTGNVAIARIATALTTPGAIGGTTASTGAFTTISGTSSATLGTNGGTGGSLVLRGSTSGNATINTSAAGVLALPSGTTATSMALTTPALGTPSSGVMNNLTGILRGLAAQETVASYDGVALSGTMYFADGTAVTNGTLTGFQTLFNTQVKVGDRIATASSGDFGSQGGPFFVKSIASNSSLTLSKSGNAAQQGIGNAVSAKIFRSLLTAQSAAGDNLVTISADGTFILGTPPAGLASGAFAAAGANAIFNHVYLNGNRLYSSGGWIALQTYNGSANVDIGLAESGTTAVHILTVASTINIPATTSTVGQIKQAGSVIFHTKSGTAGAGNGSVYLGISSGLVTNTAENNVGVGAFALSSTNASLNVGVGYCAMQHNVTGTDNVAFGSFALRNGTASTFNVAIGTRALNVCNGAQNLAVGYESLQLLTSGSNNTGFGFQSGYYATGSNNVFVGASAGNILNEAGSNNTFIGAAAVPNGTAYTFCTALGAGAIGTASNQVMLGRATDTVQVPGTINIPTTTSTVGQIKQNGTRLLHSYGTQNLFLGDSAGNFTLTGLANTGIGRQALTAIAGGISNVAIGDGTMIYLTSGDYNLAIGRSSLNVLVSGSQNTAVGASALPSATGGNNVGIGFQAGYAIGSGSGNVSIGQNSLVNAVNSYATLSSTSNCTLIGTLAEVTTSGQTTASYRTAIGSESNATADNQVMLGRAADIVTLPGGLVTVPIAQTATTAAVSVAVTTTALTTTAPAQAITLANGTNGQIKIVTHIASSGAGTAVLTPATSAADYNTITFSSVGDTATLQYHTTGGWYILSLRGAVAA